MELNIKAPVVALEAGQIMTLDDARGTRILPRHGLVWVTEENDTHDHILGPGEAFVLARGGRTVIQALQPAWISLAEGLAAANDPA